MAPFLASFTLLLCGCTQILGIEVPAEPDVAEAADAAVSDAVVSDAVLPDAAVPDAVLPDAPTGVDAAGGTDASLCVTGETCTLTDLPCHLGKTVCPGLEPECMDTGFRPTGELCGANRVCHEGECKACVDGETCVADNPCLEGKFSCAQYRCESTSVKVANGTACSQVNFYCRDGFCNACEQGASCALGVPCQIGAIACSTGSPVCAKAANEAPGTGCGDNQICDAQGACITCQEGLECTPSPLCKTGLLACASGQPVCNANGNVADGTACGSGLVCYTGACDVPNAAFVVDSGGAQTVLLGQSTSAIVLKLTDKTGAAIFGASVTFTAPEGAFITPSSVTTSGLGKAVVVARVGRKAGVYTFTATTPLAPPFEFTVTASEPALGTIFSVVNVEHMYGDAGIPGAGTVARTGAPYALTRAQDGSLYVGDADLCRVYKLSPLGQLTTVAGTSCGSSGDFGLATKAQFGSPSGLALDEVNQRLYISGYDFVKYVDFPSSKLFPYAGGGTAGGPGYGDGGSAQSANLYYAGALSVGPDSSLYISDAGHNLIRRVAFNTETIGTWLGTGTCGSGLTIASSYDGAGTLVWNSLGSAFVTGYFCSTAPGFDGQTFHAIVRVSPDGKQFAKVAGDPGSSVSDGLHSGSTSLNQPSGLALDSAGNLFYAEYGGHRIRRIDAKTGLATTIAGDGTFGYKGDYVASTLAQLYNPVGLVMDAKENLFVADRYNYAVRAVWGAGQTSPGTLIVAKDAGDLQTTELVRLVTTPPMVKLTDGEGVAVRGVPVSFASLDAGAVVMTAVAKTSSLGRAAVAARPGLLPKDYRVQATFTDIHGSHVTGSPAVFTLTAKVPSGGTIFTAVNTDHTSGESGIPGAAAVARVGRPHAILAAKDGSVYLTDYDYCKVRKLSPVGVLTDVVGSSCGDSADSGAAITAKLGNPRGLALDEAKQRLYVSDSNDKVRLIELSSGIISTYAGGAKATEAGAQGPGFGDGGPATSAGLYTPGHLSIGPDGALYIADTNHYRVRRVDPMNDVISTWLPQATDCAVNLLAISGTYDAMGDIVWDASGNAYIAAFFCGTLAGFDGNSMYAIVRRDPMGNFKKMAGTTDSTITADGLNRIFAFLNQPNGIALWGTDLYVTEGGNHRVRRLSTNEDTVITTVAGPPSPSGMGGYAGDYVAGTQAQLNYPWGIDVTPDGQIVVADHYNACLRYVWTTPLL